jgi:hypothetical protein
MHPMKYIKLLMYYIEQEYDNIPEYLTPEMDEHFRECYERQESIPNAAGMFYEAFLRDKVL